MPKERDERDDPSYLNYLLLRGLQEICHQADVPVGVQETIVGVIEAKSYEISPRLRREADSVGCALGQKILDLVAGQLQDEMEDEDDDWDDALVSEEKAEENKMIWLEALKNGNEVKLRYVSIGSEETLRTVKPTGTRGPYGEGYCHLRKADRVFRFDRMLEITSA